MTLPSGETHVFQENWSEHLLTLEQAHTWLSNAGFTNEQEYGDYKRNPITENEYNNTIIWAKKM